MIKILKKLRVLLDKKQKYSMVGLIVLMIIGAFLQTLGVGLLVEVVNVAVDPNVVETNWLAAELYRLMGSPGSQFFSCCDDYADHNVRMQESIPVYSTETDIFFCIYKSVPYFGADDAQLSAAWI